MDFKLDYRWLEPPRNIKDASAFTWAEFSMYVGNECITTHEDFMAKSVGERLYIPLYFFAEWCATNWWNLVYQPLNPETDRNKYYYSHKIKYARSGFSLPDLLIQPQGPKIFLQWRYANLEHHKCRFLNDGLESIDAEQFREELSFFIESVVTRLEKSCVTNSQLQNEWKLIKDSITDSEEEDFCIAVAEAGLDPYNCSEDDSQTILTLNGILSGNILQEFLYSLDHSKLKNSAKAIDDIRNIVSTDTDNSNKIRTIRNSITNKYTYTTPWQEGYNAARNLREKIGLNGSIVKTVNELSEIMKIDLEQDKSISEEIISSSIKLFVGVNKYSTPVFILPKIANKTLWETNKKFSIARGLYEYFYGDELSLISNVDVESQKRNKAFAAEFLLPSSTLRKRIKNKYVYEDQIDDLAEEFKISSKVVEHQIVNHQIAEIGYY